MKHNDPLTLAAARAHFREFWLPTLRSSDRPAVRLAWSQFIDALHRERKISDKQAHSWDIPESFGRPRKATRKNPSCGCRTNPSKGRKPKRATKKPSRASAKPRRTKPITARKRR